MTRGDRMAVAGFACSVAVLLITALMILLPSLADVPDAVIGLLLLAGAILWVSGLVLSLLARSRTHRFHRLATTGMIVSIASALLFVVLLVFLVLLVGWLLDDLFVVG